MTVKELIDKLQ